MAISSSSFALGVAQADGRRECVETHVDSAGLMYMFSYLSDPSADNQAILVQHAARLLDRIKEIELYLAVFVLPWDYVLVHTTNNDLAAFVREQYRTAIRETLAMVAKRILEWIANGRFSDTQVRTAFGLGLVEWLLLKGKMETLVTDYDAVQAAAGE